MSRAAAADPLAAVAASAAGARLLGVLRSPRTETYRNGRRGPSMASAIEQVAITGDGLVDVLDGREPLRFSVTWPGAAAPLARELRARLRGDVIRDDWGDVAELRTTTPPELAVRVLPGEAADARPDSLPTERGQAVTIGRWSDPVLTARAARLTLDGRIDDPSGDLAARRVRLRDPDGFRRRPEALLQLARLGSRPGWTIEPETLAAARAARAAGALATAPVVHLGAAFELLVAAPELVAAITLLHELAPEVPLAAGVEVDEQRLRAAAATPDRQRAVAVLRALAPGATRGRLAAFLLGARLYEPYRVVDAAFGRALTRPRP